MTFKSNISSNIAQQSPPSSIHTTPPSTPSNPSPSLSTTAPTTPDLESQPVQRSVQTTTISPSKPPAYITIKSSVPNLIHRLARSTIYAYTTSMSSLLTSLTHLLSLPSPSKTYAYTTTPSSFSPSHDDLDAPPGLPYDTYQGLYQLFLEYLWSFQALLWGWMEGWRRNESGEGKARCRWCGGDE